MFEVRQQARQVAPTQGEAIDFRQSAIGVVVAVLLKAGRVEFRVEKAGIIQTPIGKASFSPEALTANLNALIDQLMKLKPASAKGSYMRSITISTTHGPGVKVDTAAYQAGGASE